MKKFLSLILFVLFLGVFLFGIVGCGEETAVEEAPEEEAAEEEVVEEEEEEEAEEPEEEALDSEEVVWDAAKAFFPLTADSNNIMPSGDVKDMLDDNPNSLFILDIRSAEDFEEGHIEGAVHSAWGEVGNIMDRLPTNRPVVVVCYSGQTAGQTVGALRMAGFDNVVSLQSGMNFGWTEEGFEAAGEGMVPAADLDSVTSPADEEEEILWEVAQDYFAGVAADNNIMPPDEVNEILEDNPNLLYVLDIRSAEDYEEGHIPGSVHSPWSEVGDLMDELPTNRPVVVACYSGQTAGQTVGVLRMAGFDAQSLQFGIRLGWVGNADLPLVTE
ncbi:MAG: rhodanese-like domain-containing protein [Bacillota bacterium]